MDATKLAAFIVTGEEGMDDGHETEKADYTGRALRSRSKEEEYVEQIDGKKNIRPKVGCEDQKAGCKKDHEVDNKPWLFRNAPQAGGPVKVCEVGGKAGTSNEARAA
jgi:hypothetical protein